MQVIKNTFIFCGFVTISLSACKKDENSFQLKRDAENFSAPLLVAGTYTGAVKFLASDLSDYQGKQLSKVTYYTLEVPQTCTLTVFTAATDSTFGQVLYTSVLTPKAESWNTHTLSNPIKIPSTDLWMGITFSHAASASVLGCDPGPAVENGDWFITSDARWKTFRTHDANTSINWNIRGLVE